MESVSVCGEQAELGGNNDDVPVQSSARLANAASWMDATSRLAPRPLMASATTRLATLGTRRRKQRECC